MEKINSYVFLQRNESQLKKDKDGTYILDLTNNVSSVLKEIFNAKDNDLTLGELETLTDETEEKFENGLLNFIESEVNSGAVVSPGLRISL